MSFDYKDMASRLAQEVEAKLGLKNVGLSGQVSRIGRRVPRRVSRDLRRVAEAAELADNPRLLPQVDQRAVDAAYARARIWLKDHDPVARRAQARRSMLAGLAVNLLLAGGLGVAVLAYFDLIGPR